VSLSTTLSDLERLGSTGPILRTDFLTYAYNRKMTCTNEIFISYETVSYLVRIRDNLARSARTLRDRPIGQDMQIFQISLVFNASVDRDIIGLLRLECTLAVPI